MQYKKELNTMLKSATISARVKPELKASAEKIFDELGLTSTEAITLFLKQVELHRGLTFNIRLPGYNADTQHAIKEATVGTDIKSFNSADDLFEDLGI
jgi:DNA-damage-inducible protein J